MNSLLTRLVLIFLLLVVLVAGGVSYAINRAVDASFRVYLQQSNIVQGNVGILEALETYYRETGTWQNAQQVLEDADQRGGGNGAGGMMGPNRGGRTTNTLPGPFMMADTSYIIVAAADASLVGQKLNRDQQRRAIAFVIDAETVGYFYQQSPSSDALAQTEQSFLAEISHTLRWISLAAIGGALVLAVVSAWWLAHPLQRLTHAAQAVARGELGTQAPVTGASEVQQVAIAFNQMSNALAESQAARKRMISDIAHELRTPISVIQGQIEGMFDGVFQTDTEHVGIVYNQTLHLARLVEDLWTLTRAEARSLHLERVPLDITAFVRETTQDFEALAIDEHINLRFEGDKDLTVEADSGRLRQVIANLLVNAIRHTPAGGRIDVSVRPKDNWAYIRVKDTGEGLPPEALPHLFERFYRADSSRQRDKGGAGLGLAIARELITLHGGEISVQSVQGVGSQFTIKLPLVV